MSKVYNLKEGEDGYWRILEYIDSIEKYFKRGGKILELGSHTPAISDYFRIEHEAQICYAGIENDIPDNPYFKYINMCTDDFGSDWDLVTASEVIEHLPCNLYPVRDKLVNAVKSGGLLFISAPVAGIGRGDRKLDDVLEFDSSIDNLHLREFNGKEELMGLFDVPELTVIDEWFSETRTMGEGSYCYNLLYRKNENE